MRHTNSMTAIVAALLAGWIGLMAAPAYSQCENIAVIPFSGGATIADTTNDTVIDTLTISGTVQSAAVHPNGGTVYLMSAGSGEITVVDTLTNAIVDTISISTPRGGAVLPDGSKLYVGNQNDATISVIDTTTNTISTTIPSGIVPSMMVPHPDGSKMYVTQQNSNNVAVINTTTDTISTTISVGGNPIGIAITPDGSEVWTANFLGDSVSIINTTTDTVVATIGGLNAAYDCTIHPDGSKAYVPSLLDNEVSVIDTTTRTVTTTIAMPGNTSGCQMHPDGTRLYVTTSSPTEAQVINTFTNTIVDTIPTGSSPSGLGTFITPSRNVTPIQTVHLDFGEIGVPVDEGDIDIFKEDGSVLMTLEKGFRTGFDPEDIGYAPATDRNVLIRQIVDQVLADFTAMGGDELNICFGARTPNMASFATVNVVNGVAPIMDVANSAVVIDLSQNRLLLDSGIGVDYSIGIEDGQLRRPDDTPVPGATFPEFLKIKFDVLGAAQYLDKGNEDLGGEAWVFAGAHNISGVADENLRELANSISHELAHLLGIEHDDGDAGSLMSPNTNYGTDKDFSDLTKRKLAEVLPPLPPLPGFLGASNRLRIAEVGDRDQHGTAMTGPLGGTTDDDAASIFREARNLLVSQCDVAEEPFQFKLSDIGQDGLHDGLYTDTPLSNGTTATYAIDLTESGIVGTYVGARIELGLCNVADVLGGASDLKLYVDGMELIGALDGVDQRLGAPEFAGYADAETFTFYLDDFLTVGQIDAALADGILTVDIDVNGDTSFISVDSVRGLVIDEGPLAISECGMGTVNLAAGPRADVLFLNGSTGGALREVSADEGDQIWAAMLLPPAGGIGKYFVHLNPGEPDNASLIALPGNVGTSCFPMISAAPLAVWNNIGKTHILGESSYFKMPLSNPQKAPTVFLQLDDGDTTFLPMGSQWTMQGVILDPQSVSPKSASTTNAVILSVQ